MPDSQGSSRRRRRRHTLAAATLVALVLAAAGGAAWAEAASPSSAYVTARATDASVAEVLEEPGNLEASRQVTLSFQVGGQVQSVTAAVGEEVTAGQVLARLDPSPLEASVASTEATASAAQARLEDDEAAQQDAAASSGGPSSTSSPGAGAAPASPQLSADQARVVSDQQQADASQSAVRQDLSDAAATCSVVPGSPGSGAGGPSRYRSPTTTSTPTSSTTTSSSTSSTTSSSTSSTTTGSSTTSQGATTTTTTSSPSTTTTPTSPAAACQQALQRAFGAEQSLSGLEDEVEAAERALAGALSSAGAAGRAAPSVTRTAGGSGGPSSVPSPEQIAADQASVDAAEAQVAVAERSLAEAALTSPIPGRVAAVAVSAGQTVPAGSSAYAITVVNPGSFYAIAQVPVAEVTELKIGDPASVTPAGQSAALRGEVTSIGVLPSSSANGASPTLPVSVSLPAGAVGLLSGAQAMIAITLGQAARALVVPTSAVRTLGSRHVVELAVAGKLRVESVSIGYVGPIYTQIRAGLNRGEAVVLADPREPLPTSGTPLPGAAARLAGLGGGFRFRGGPTGGAQPAGGRRGAG